MITQSGEQAHHASGHSLRRLPRDAEALDRIYQQLDELEPVESDQEAIRPVAELFFLPLSIAFLLALAATVLAMQPGMSGGVMAT